MNSKELLTAIVGIRVFGLRRLLLGGALMMVAGSAFAASNLVVNQTDNPDPGAAGGNFAYSIEVTNSGPDTATGVSLADTLPSGSIFVSATPPSGGSCSAPSGGVVNCSLPDMPQSVTPLTTVITVTLPTAGAYTNNVSVTSATNSPATVDAQPQNTTALAASDMQINASSSSATVVAGQAYSYTLSATNNGPDAVEAGGAIHISFSVPTGASITSRPSGAGWNCAPSSGYPLSSGTVTCSAASIASGATSNNITVNAVANVTGSVAAAFTASATKSNGDPMPDGNSSNDTTTTSVTVSAGSDVSISATATPNPVAQGSNVSYTLTPRFNGGLEPGSTGSGIITVTSTLDAGLTYVPASATGTGWTCSDSGQTLTCTRPGPYTGGNFTNMPQISFQATSTTSGTLNNSFNIAIPETDPDMTNNSGVVGVTSSNEADLSLTKTTTLNPVVPGQDFAYNLVVRDNGLLAVAAGQTITVTDDIPAGVTVTSAPSGSGWACTPSSGYPAAGPVTISCTRSGPLSANSNAPTISIPAQITTTGTIGNTASVGLTGAGPVDTNSSNDSGSVNVTASGTSANLAITKTASGDVNAGQPLTYTLVVSNAGPDASTNVTVTDALSSLINTGGLQSITTTQGACTPAALPANGTSQNVSCNLGTLNNGANATITITVLPNIAVTGTRTNTASVTSPDIGDPDRTNNSASASSTVTAVVDLAMAKSATPSSVAAGAPLNYVATITNNGPSSAQDVAMTDTLPTNATFIDLVNVSNSGTCGTVPNAGDAGGTLACTWPSAVASGSQRTVTYRVRPLVSAVGSTVDNSVTASTSTIETNSANNTATTSTPVTPVDLDVLINKTVSNASVPLGGNTTYTVTVTNNGPSEATGVEMTDSFPAPASNYPITITPPTPTAVFSYQGGLTITPSGAGTCVEPAIGATSGVMTCSFPTLDQAQSVTISYNQKAESITQPGALSGTTTNFASVKVNETESIPVNNNYASQSTSTFRPSSNADLAVTKTLTDPSNGVLIPGNNAVYELSVTNNGPDSSQSAQVTDTLPAGLTFVSAPGCIFNNGTVSCDLGTLANGATQTFTVTTTVNKPYNGVTPLINEADVDAPGDPVPGNNKSTVNTPVIVPHDVPVLSNLAMILLAALMGVVGVFVYRRR
ncbi:IPTL-CTERM sorting domain-containing protein [Halothiobacillus sp.]|uniref:IPTL-CTERM sorting domain-containing protein n=1 Tax=Halothiobacillus sp. TaxID=1891311 RepID=UPI00261FA183|nr:IPTL-CTERM sorting domain-containing protein [Halothiobacillus sp.]MDD4965466.1 IPTL-CTERM sorting domain-containing protein [Halothiobacillus sp.]